MTITFWRCLLVLGSLLTTAVAPASAQRNPTKYVLFLDAHAAENSPCLARVGARTCANEARAFLDWINGAELWVVNRKFLADYSVQIDGVTKPISPGIRGLEEVANLTLGAPSLIPPPSKGSGGTPTITARTTSEFLSQLVDEAQAEKPLATILADSAELQRELRAASVILEALTRKTSSLTTGTANADCLESRNAPNVGDAIRCLQDAEKRQRAAKRNINTDLFDDENQFRRFISDAGDLIELVSALQAALGEANLPTAASNVEGELTQIEKNIAAFRSNVLALESAIRIHSYLVDAPESYRSLRRAQLRAAIRRDLKAVAGDAPTDVDGEINALVFDYVQAVARNDRLKLGPLAELNTIRIRDWKSFADTATTRLNARRRTWVSTSSTIDALPEQIDSINDAQSRMVTHLNYMRDNSGVATALVKQIDLSTYTGNLKVYYTIVRTDNYARYRVRSPSVVTNRSAATSDAAPTPPTGEGNATPPPATVKVASGTVEVHDFDRATIVGAFAFSKLSDNAFVTRANPGVENSFVVVQEMPHGQQHVVIGLEYYFIQNRDSYPGAARGWSMIGAFGGISVNYLNNFFLGLAIEPVPGVNLTGGWHRGKETILQRPLAPDSVISTATAPTTEHYRTRPFVSVGLDLQLFRKIFGKVIGLGATDPVVP
ncbi:MAG: hypothetical protein Q8K82_02375 [Gemmatimonadaceae bacterium]|nr:hypothetical protein [Gemmatimonadaceae bacterium]